jgi:hypothetical protein|tara:strand:- start:625 stop:1317 length:693 start_codon:yes stop_codon:yes gene_type:complete
MQNWNSAKTQLDNSLKFNFIFLGQSVLKYEVPLDVYNILNQVYETRRPELPPANVQLVGKIQNEHSLFFDGPPNNKMHPHNFLPENVTQWFRKVMKHYLDWNKVRGYKMHLNSIWINEMKANEYNPVHVHQGALFTGLSSVMILKLPQDTGVEYSAPGKPMNGQLQILGNSSGQFCNTDYGPFLKERNFYVFPYDMRHCVYPFNSTDEVRRTLSCNMDVEYDPIKNRSAS